MTGFAEKLKLARLGAGLSQQELADLSGAVTKQMISKYERGRALPASDKLARIAKAVGRKPGFLMRAPAFDPALVKFRHTGVLSQKQIAQVQAEIAVQLEGRIDLEHVLGIDRSACSGLANAKRALASSNRAVAAALSSTHDALETARQSVEDLADRLREAWDLGTNPIPNVSEMLERQGIHVLPTEAPEGFDGMSTRVGDDHGVVVVRDTLPQDPFRFRFTLLHELGHLVLDLPETTHHATAERLCNRFAGALLFPAARVREEFGDYRSEIFLEELVEQKCRYGISVMAQSYRLAETGVIKDALRLKIRKWLNETDERRYEIGLGEFPSERCGDYNDQLLRRALAEELVTMSKAAEIKNVGVREVRQFVKEARGW